MQVIREQPM